MATKLLDWINIDKINWNCLSANPAAIHLLEANQDKIDWIYLSVNPGALHLLEANPDKIEWFLVSCDRKNNKQKRKKNLTRRNF